MHNFSGAITALVTPMKNGTIDFKALQELVEFQISEGIHGLLPCGTTGEGATMRPEDMSRVIRSVVEQTKGRVPVIAGAGSNSTEIAVQHSKMAKESGANAILQVTPYYNKPSVAGLMAHYQAISNSMDLPIILYNVPSRTGCDMLPETVAQLAKIPRIIGIKEATGSIARTQSIIAKCGFNFLVFSGDDATSFSLMTVGACGVISVVSNVVPGPMAKMMDAARAGKISEARSICYGLLPLMDVLFIESNPIPVKAALSMMGYGDNELRLPLVPLQGEKLEQLRNVMKAQKLIG